MGSGENPIRIEAYWCHVCDAKMITSHDEAYAHVNTPVDSPLPEGLIWNLASSSSYPYMYIPDGCMPSLTQKHSFKQRCVYVTDNRLFGVDFIDSRAFKEQLKKGMCALLSPEEFEKITQEIEQKFEQSRAYFLKNREQYSRHAKPHFEEEQRIVREFIRTTPELEALVLQAAESK